MDPTSPSLLLLLLLLLSRVSRVRLCATPETAPNRLLRPWDSPGKNTGVGCHRSEGLQFVLKLVVAFPPDSCPFFSFKREIFQN